MGLAINNFCFGSNCTNLQKNYYWYKL